MDMHQVEERDMRASCRIGFMVLVSILLTGAPAILAAAGGEEPAESSAEPSSTPWPVDEIQSPPAPPGLVPAAPTGEVHTVPLAPDDPLDRGSVGSDGAAGQPSALPTPYELLKLGMARRAAEAAGLPPPGAVPAAIPGSEGNHAPDLAPFGTGTEPPLLGTIPQDALDRAREEVRTAPAAAAGFEDTERMRQEAELVRQGRYPNGTDDDATHYARGSTLILHIFVNHLGGTWSSDERSVAGARAVVAKTFWHDRSPAGAELHFDNEGASGYWYRTATVPYDIRTTSNDWCEDALAALGGSDNDGDGWIIDDFSRPYMNWNGGWDNVIVCFQAADFDGRAWASFVFARAVLYANSDGGAWCHEWGHVFGTCDEYIENGQCGDHINCGPCQGWYLSWVEDNQNCDLATCLQDLPCVMDDNGLELCQYSYNQAGWADDNADGTLNNTKRRIIDESYVNIVEIPSGHQAYSANVSDGYALRQRWNTWAVAGLRSPAGADYNLNLYGENNHSYLLASSNQISPNVDFVVSDYNHDRLGIENLQVTNESGAGSYRLHYDCGTAMLYPDGVERAGTWQGPYVTRIWDVPLFAGETISFTVTPTSGTCDFGMALFRSNGSYYHTARAGALWTRDVYGAGEVESYAYTVPADDVYGFVLWANAYAAGTYSIRIGPDVVTLAEESPVVSSAPLNLYTYTANATSWSFIGTRPGAGTNATIRLFDDSAFQVPLATSDDWNGVEFVAVDYTGGVEQDYARVTREAGNSTLRTEWEQGDNDLSGYFSGGWLVGHVGKMWDVSMVAGQEYFFREYHVSPTLDTALYLFRSTTGSTYQSKAQAVGSSDSHPPADGGEYFWYTAPASDTYGLATVVNDESYGSYSLWFGPKFELPEDQAMTSLNEVVWSQCSVTSRAWTVFGIRAAGAASQEIALYADAGYGSDVFLAGQGAATGVSYVVGDYNHNPLAGAFQRYRRTSGTGAGVFEWDGEVQRLGFVPGQHQVYDYSWPAGDVIEAYDVHVDGSIPNGEDVTIEVSDLSGSMDFGLALFASNGTTYFADPSSAMARADAAGAGGTELITCHFTREDWYGLVVYNKSGTGGSYRIRLIDPDLAGVETVEPIRFELRTTSGNPFAGTLTLEASIPAGGPGDLSIYDVKGRKVATLLEGNLRLGLHRLEWDARDEHGNPVASGVYFARLRLRDQELKLKLVRTR
jgi:hypothetical protein